MWFLLMVFLTIEHPDVVLKHYQTAEECQTERNRIGFDMAEAYPWEHDFDVVCRLKKKMVI